MEQTYKNVEIVITKNGKMAQNTNTGILKATGKYIKILYLDDYFSSPTSLQRMVEQFTTTKWLMVGTNNNIFPRWTDNIETGNNKLGSPSALMMVNEEPLLFDERMSWMLDCDLYKRMEKRWGKPKILAGDYVTIGEGDHQVSHIMTDDEKRAEERFMQEKYAKN